MSSREGPESAHRDLGGYVGMLAYGTVLFAVLVTAGIGYLLWDQSAGGDERSRQRGLAPHSTEAR